MLAASMLAAGLDGHNARLRCCCCCCANTCRALLITPLNCPPTAALHNWPQAPQLLPSNHLSCPHHQLPPSIVHAPTSTLPPTLPAATTATHFLYRSVGSLMSLMGSPGMSPPYTSGWVEALPSSAPMCMCSGHCSRLAISSYISTRTPSLPLSWKAWCVVVAWGGTVEVKQKVGECHTHCQKVSECHTHCHSCWLVCAY